MNRLVRSKNKQLGGVLAGIAEYLNVDPTVIIVIYILLSVFTGFIPGIIAYIIMTIVIPTE